MIATAEDLIVAKLDWAKQGESHRQITDVANILKIRSNSLDHKYIDKWANDLGLTAEWGMARREAGLQ